MQSQVQATAGSIAWKQVSSAVHPHDESDSPTGCAHSVQGKFCGQMSTPRPAFGDTDGSKLLRHQSHVLEADSTPLIEGQTPESPMSLVPPQVLGKSGAPQARVNSAPSNTHSGCLVREPGHSDSRRSCHRSIPRSCIRCVGDRQLSVTAHTSWNNESRGARPETESRRRAPLDRAPQPL